MPAFRFSLLSMAACEAPLLLNIGGFRSGKAPGLPYGQNVTFVANDWHAGLVPVYVASRYRKYNVYKDARCVLALHNLAHQVWHGVRCGAEPTAAGSRAGAAGARGGANWMGGRGGVGRVPCLPGA